MKLSNTILLVTLCIGTAGIFGSNYVMKREYDKIDKSEPYWNYKKVNGKPFSHLVISGGNITNIVYEQSPTSYVKIMSEWRGASNGSVKSKVINDTLYLAFDNSFQDLYEKYWLQTVVPIRIASPGLLSVHGENTKLVVDKFNQPDLNINLSGDSKIQVNCFRTGFNNIEVTQSDSSLTAFTVSKELFVGDSISIKKVSARGSGTSLLNLRSATIDSLNLQLTDRASVALSGQALQKWSRVDVR